MIVLVALIGWTSIGASDTIPASQLVESVSLSAQLIGDVSFVVTWNDSFDDGPTTYTTLSTVYDSLGRIRVTEIDKGTYGNDGTQMSSRTGRRDMLFDGEKSVVLNTFTDLDGVGRPIRTRRGVYRQAVVADAMASPSKWRRSLRNPIAIAPRQLLSTLDVLARLERAVEVSAAKYGEDEALVLTYQQGGLDVTATVVPTQSWAVRELTHKDSTGEVKKRFKAGYRRTTADIWLPTSGELMFFVDDANLPVEGLPALNRPLYGESGSIHKVEWRFEVSDLLVNDPEFDESIFAVSIPKGTRLTDNRYKTTYTVGGVETATDEIGALALRARADDKRFPHELSAAPQYKRFYTYAVYVVVGVAIFTVAMAVRVFRRRVPT